MTVHTVSVLTLNCLNIYCILNVMSTFNIVKIKCLKKNPLIFIDLYIDFLIGTGYLTY